MRNPGNEQEQERARRLVGLQTATYDLATRYQLLAGTLDGVPSEESTLEALRHLATLLTQHAEALEGM